MNKIILTIILSIFSLSVFAQGHTVDAAEFEKQLKSAKSEQLIDVRTPAEFEKNRIAKAQNINVKSADFQKYIEKLDKNKPVFVYCVRGARSKSAMTILEQAGFKTIYNLNGGLNAWIKAEKPVESGE